jgi:hypothetical protein
MQKLARAVTSVMNFMSRNLAATKETAKRPQSAESHHRPDGNKTLVITAGQEAAFQENPSLPILQSHVACMSPYHIVTLLRPVVHRTGNFSAA